MYLRIAPTLEKYSAARSHHRGQGGKQSLTEDAEQLDGKRPSHGVSQGGRKKELQAFDGVHAAGGVQSSQDEVPGFASLDSGRCCLGIAISPTKIGSGSCRSDRRKPSAKLGVSMPTSRWVNRDIR